MLDPSPSRMSYKCNARREYFARARKAVLSDPFPPDLRLRFEEAMDRVDDLLARLGHRPLPREKYRWPIRMSNSYSRTRDEV